MERFSVVLSTARNSWANLPARNRFSMPENWQSVGAGAGSGMYVLGNSLAALRRMSTALVVVDPQFDLERFGEDGDDDDEEDAITRAAKKEKNEKITWSSGVRQLGMPHSRSASSSTYNHTGTPANNTNNTNNPFQDPLASTTNLKSPFGDSKAVLSQYEPSAISRPPTPAPITEKPYHVFSKRQKWVVVIIIGAAGLFSGLSSNIYFPSLSQIATDLNVSLSTVSLSITSYLIVQGFSPVIWGAFSDALGRRPIYIASFSVYILSNIVLSFSPNFVVLMVFRGLQAAGSASTVSIGNGVIQDISPPATRGAYISFYQAIRNFSIAIGPVLGGILANAFGFRSVFVFLLIISTMVLFVIVFFLPETMRRLAGDGSLRLPGIYKPVIYRVRGEPAYMQDPEDSIRRKKITIGTFVSPLRLLTQKEILMNLVFGGVVYAVWSMVTSSTTGLFSSNFHLNETLIGLAFLPNGLGTIIGSTIIGQLMTRDYKAAEARYKRDHSLPDDYKLPAKDLPADFPIEKARQRRLWWVTILFIATTAGYGYSLDSVSTASHRGLIAIPLILQFFIAGTSNAVFAMNQTLISDMCPGKGASGTAVNNLVRCTLGAAGVAVIENMISALGPGMTFLVLALVVVASTPLAVASWAWGMKWRAERVQRKASRVEEKA